ncbi:2'-5' RNA ligase family protein [Bacillus cereus]|uniref:2'-5' RNA ligase n=1 Tax=Bacillus cereus TaxID=1396 RepID=A0A2B9DFF6_BACCE|nr:2'-5' RNA ligase family protein [Bacillus cereus]PGM91428.1 2'-5' RNA ligase [Bacillus cereus]
MRTILLFLQNMPIDEIESMREKHDPLFGLIPRHMTIVFPFESSILNDELELHILKMAKGVHPIEIEFANRISSKGEYLFLEVERGKEKIEELHDRLYTGPLLQFLRTDIPSFHEKLNCVIDRISVERIGKNGESIIEFEVPLQKS